MSENCEKMESVLLESQTAELLRQLAEEQKTSVSGLLAGISSFLPLLCGLNEAGAREYQEFSVEYSKLIGAEDCFLSTMTYLDYTQEEAPARPGTRELLRTLLGLAYANSLPEEEREKEGYEGSIVAAVTANF